MYGYIFNESFLHLEVMKNQSHILNGDALLHQMENLINGDKIVCRECMIEGGLQGETLDEFFENRALSFQEFYKVSQEEYIAKSKDEILRIKNIPKEAEINLWFEDDLFCQTNFWFIVNLLVEFKLENDLYLVRPSKGNEYNFGMMSAPELKQSFENRTRISEKNTTLIQKLWNEYRVNNTPGMIKVAQELHEVLPFIGPAVYAHISNRLGIPQQKLQQIKNESNTNEFGPVFQEFCKHEKIYGFGDLQVKRMFDKLD